MISAIVLAAGQAARLGRCKQLLRIGGKTILDHALDNLRGSKVDEIVVVLGAYADEIRQTVRIPERIVLNPDYVDGMSTSIRAGLRALSAETEAALIVLGDQPFVRPATVDRLIDEYRSTGADAVVPTHEGARGNPVLVDRSLFPKMLEIRGDTGCRAIFGEHARSLVKLEVDDRGILTDIDTAEDYEAASQPAEPYATATVVRAERPTSSKPGDNATIAADGTLTGWIGGSCTHDLVVKHALDSIREGEPRLLAISPGDPAPLRDGVVGEPMQCWSGGALDIFIEPHLPVPQLVVVGSQPVAKSLAKIAATMHFRVTAVESPSQLDRLPRGAGVFIVVATHGQFDEEALERAARTGARYIALVASRKRGGMVMESMRARGVAVDRVKWPAGLDIGARGADEIALSILAEIVQVRRAATPITQPAPQPETATDPICRMSVTVAGARYVAEHEGRRYYFCCEHCQRTFEREPHRYADVA